MKRSIVVSLCALIMCLFVGCGAGQDVDEIMAETIESLNAECPMVVDEITTLDNVEFIEGKYFVYNYKISVDDSEIDFDILSQNLTAALNADKLKEIDPTGVMKENGISLRYSYVDQDGDLIGKADFEVVY